MEQNIRSPGSIARKLLLDCDTVMRRSEQQSAEMRQADNFFFVLIAARQRERGREIAADRGAGADSFFLFGDIKPREAECIKP